MRFNSSGILQENASDQVSDNQSVRGECCTTIDMCVILMIFIPSGPDVPIKIAVGRSIDLDN